MATTQSTQSVTLRELSAIVDNARTSPCRIATIRYRKDDGSTANYAVLLFTREDKAANLAQWQRPVTVNIVHHASSFERVYILAKKLFSREANGAVVRGDVEYRLFKLTRENFVSLTFNGTRYTLA